MSLHIPDHSMQTVSGLKLEKLLILRLNCLLYFWFG